jgi:hypothetical protein
MPAVSEVLPIVVPFFGTVLLISCATTTCFWRRSRRELTALADRLTALEARYTAPPSATAPLPTVVPMYNMQPYRPAYYPGPQTMYPMPSAPLMPSAPPISSAPKSINL